MIETTARVLAVEPGVAWVELRRGSACSGCSAGSGCGTAALAAVLGTSRRRLPVSDGIGVAVGDRVVIGVAEGALTRASLLAYLLPLMTLLSAASLAQSTGAGEGAVALAGLLGLGLGMLGAGRLTRTAPAEETYRPRLLRLSGGPEDGAGAVPRAHCSTERGIRP